MGRLIEGLWDCKYCNSKGIKGGQRQCPNCGHTRDDDVKFYMPGSITYVDENKAKTINRNPDWICMYCNGLNSDNDAICKSCGADRTEKNLNYFQNQEQKLQEQRKKINDIINSNCDCEVTDKHSPDSNHEVSNKNKLKTFLQNNWKFLLIVPALALLILALVFIFTPKEEFVTITDLKWEYSVNIEKFETINEDDWELPIDARLLYTNTELYGHDQVIDHYETKSRQVEKTRLSGYENYVSGYRDLGNGYFEEIIDQRPIYETYYEIEYYEEPVYKNVPIYKTKYYYERDVWNYCRTVKFNGNDKNPKWGEIKVNDLERISQSSKKEKYYVVGVNLKDETKECEFTFNEWNSLEKGYVIKFKSLFGKNTELEIIETVTIKYNYPPV